MIKLSECRDNEWIEFTDKRVFYMDDEIVNKDGDIKYIKDNDNVELCNIVIGKEKVIILNHVGIIEGYFNVLSHFIRYNEGEPGLAITFILDNKLEGPPYYDVVILKLGIDVVSGPIDVVSGLNDERDTIVASNILHTISDGKYITTKELFNEQKYGKLEVGIVCI